MTTHTSTLIAAEPLFNEEEEFALAGFLAAYSGLTREAYALDLRQFVSWCIELGLRIFEVRRAIVIGSPPLESATFQVENIRWTYVFYESGLSINVLCTLDGTNPKRAVGFKLSKGMDIPAELGPFKFARQKSKLAGTIRGTYFVIKSEY